VSHSNTCNQPLIPSDACYIRFGDGKIRGAVVLRPETVRGETLVLDIDKEGKIIGIELIQPGTKPCQPLWTHGADLSREEGMGEEGVDPNSIVSPIPPAGILPGSDDTPDDEGEGGE